MASKPKRLFLKPTPNPLEGKNSIPSIERLLDPGLKLIELGVLMEGMLRTFDTAVPMISARNCSNTLGELAARNSSRFQNAKEVLWSVSVRNRRVHCDRELAPPSMTEMEHAAEYLQGGIEDILEYLPEDVRQYATTDHHATAPSLPLSEIVEIVGGRERILRLDDRLNALLAAIDQREARPRYDLRVQQTRPSTIQRVKRHSRRFDCIGFWELLGACEAAAALREGSEVQEIDLAKVEKTITAIVSKWEVDLGWTPAPPASIVLVAKQEEAVAPIPVQAPAPPVAPLPVQVSALLVGVSLLAGFALGSLLRRSL